MDEQPNIGDLVRLASDKYPMVVYEVRQKGYVNCLWRNKNGSIDNAPFHHNILMRYEEPIPSIVTL